MPSAGPNNQIAGLKEGLVLGKLIKRTVIMHDILNHYSEKEDAKTPESMPFELVSMHESDTSGGPVCTNVNQDQTAYHQELSASD